MSLENLFAPKAEAPPPAPPPAFEAPVAFEAPPAAPPVLEPSGISLALDAPVGIPASAFTAPPPPSAPAPPFSSVSGNEISLSLDSSSDFQLEQSSKAPVASISEAPTHPGTPVAPAAAPQAAVPAAMEISLATEVSPAINSAPAAPSASSAPIKIARVAKRAARQPTPQLIAWDHKLLKGGTDPLGKGLVHFLEKGATAALFLAITQPPEGCPVPHFNATATVNADGGKLGIWTGLKWDPTVVPELWNYFIKAGYTELPPPGSFTNVKSNRNVVRAAFGVEKEEWILLVRAGPANSCRGVVAVISKKSLLNEITTALPLLATLPVKAA